jgi:hypothetical protein
MMRIIESPSRNEEKAILPAPPPTGVEAAEPQADKKTVRRVSAIAKVFVECVLAISISLIPFEWIELWLIVPRLGGNKPLYCSSF